MSEHDPALEDAAPETTEAPAADVEAEAPEADATPVAEEAAADAIEEAPEAPAAEEEAPAEEAPVAEEPEAPAAPVAEPAALKPAIEAQDLSDLPDDIDFEAALNMTMLDFEEGDIVKGHVVAIGRDEVLVDIGFKSEGVIPLNELSIRKAVDPSTVVSEGEEIEALVLDKEDEEGRLVLSKKRAQYERAWGRIEQVAAAKETVTGPVIEVVKGGLIVDIGLRGFLPASLVELRRVRDLDPYIGETIEAKVIEIDRNRNNVVLSRRAYLEEEQAEQRQAFLDELAEGNIAEGVVSSVVNFGAFVDLGGMDGLVHVSELSYQHVNHPSEVVKVGDKVTVKVLEVDRDRERISLSIKQTQKDPWEEFSVNHAKNDRIKGSIKSITDFGIFIGLDGGIDGLVHLSDISWNEPGETAVRRYSKGEEIETVILSVDPSASASPWASSSSTMIRSPTTPRSTIAALSSPA